MDPGRQNITTISGLESEGEGTFIICRCFHRKWKNEVWLFIDIFQFLYKDIFTCNDWVENLHCRRC